MPLLLNVWVPVPVRVKPPVWDHTCWVDFSAKLPATVMDWLPAMVIVPSTSVESQLAQFAPWVAMVTVKADVPLLLRLLKITASDEVGTDAPPLPPDVVDQCVVVLSQFPDPPTQ